MRTPPLLDLTLTDLPQLTHVRDLSRHGALDHLDASADGRALGQRVRGRHGLDLDDADARVVLAAVVHAVALVAHPGLQQRTVVFLHDRPVRDHRRGARDGGPRAVGREERNVRVRVRRDVGCLAGFRVRVEEQVDAAGFLVGGELARRG